MNNYRVLDSEPLSESSFISLNPQEETVKEETINPFNNTAEATTITMSVGQRNTEFEDALQKITQQFTNTIRAIANDREPPRRKKTPFKYTFSGEDFEDPGIFIIKLDRYFENAGIVDDDEKLTILDDQLRGEAREWRKPYLQLDEAYYEVCDRFKDHFNSTEKVTAAMSVLYGSKQGAQEKVTPFITKKQGLFERLAPTTRIDFRIDSILNQLDVEIRSRLRGRHFVTIEELIMAASHVENDLGPRSYGTTRRNIPPRDNQVENFRERQVEDRTRKKPPSPCRFCQAWHYQSECPRNPYRNNQPVRNEPEASHVRPGLRRVSEETEPNWN